MIFGVYGVGIYKHWYTAHLSTEGMSSQLTHSTPASRRGRCRCDRNLSMSDILLDNKSGGCQTTHIAQLGTGLNWTR